MGSWKIIESSAPRMRLSARSFSEVSSTPPSRTAPEAMLPAGRGSRPISARLVTDLPQPDSPTMPSVRPGRIENETSSTARTIPASVTKSTLRRSTSSNASLMVSPTSSSGPFGVQRVLQAVGEQVETHHQREQEAGGDDEVHVMPGDHFGGGFGDHQAPADAVGNAQPEKAENHFRLDRRDENNGGLHHQDMERVGHDVAKDDDQRMQANGARGLDEFEVLEFHDLAAHQPRRGGPEGRDHCDVHRPWIAVEGERDGGDEQVERNRIEHTLQPQDDRVDGRLREVARQRTEHRAQQGRCDRHDQPDFERGAGGKDRPCKNVLAQYGGAEPVFGRRRLPLPTGDFGPVAAPPVQPYAQRDDEEGHHNSQPDHGGPVGGKA